jgi:hypothetical protein
VLHLLLHLQPHLQLLQQQLVVLQPLE